MLFRSEELPPLDDLGALVESNSSSQLEMAMPSRDLADDSDGDTLNVPISMGEGLVHELEDEVEPAADGTGDAPPPGSQLH